MNKQIKLLTINENGQLIKCTGKPENKDKGTRTCEQLHKQEA